MVRQVHCYAVEKNFPVPLSLVMLTDLKIASRRIAASPAFTLAVLLTLALTIALSTTVFSVLDAMFFRPLPYSQPERIVEVKTMSRQGYPQTASYPDYLDWRDGARQFSALAAYWPWSDSNLDTGSNAAAVHSVSTSDNFFDVFAVSAQLGRTFRRGDDKAVVLSDEVWRSVFHSDPDVISRLIRIDGKPMTVVGVMPRGFRFPINRTNAVYFPLQMTTQRPNRDSDWLRTVGRLRPGVTIAAAQQGFNRLLHDLGKIYPKSEGRIATLVDLPASVGDGNSDALRLLFYAVLTILAIGCVNLSGMFLARAIRFQREMAVRSALGAGRLELIRQILAENLLLGVAGALLGAAIAYSLLQTVALLLAAALPRGAEVELNVPVLCLSLVCAVGCSLLAGLLPALGLSKAAENLALRSGTRTGQQRSDIRLRGGFVMVQVALALTLLFTAGMVFRMLNNLRNQPMGFDASHILTADIELSAGNYTNKDIWADFAHPLLERVQALPGVRAAGLIQMLPIQSYGWNEEVHMAGEPPNPPNEERMSEIRYVTPGYYRVFGLHLLKGRLFDDAQDNLRAERVQVVNQRFVDRFIPKGRDPVGMYMDEGKARVRIVGVTSDVQQSITDGRLAEMDWPVSQLPLNIARDILVSVHLVVRTDGSPKEIIPALRQIYHQLDPQLPFRTPETMEDIITESLNFQRLENWMFGSFAALAFLLAIVGLYGVISHEVQASTRDIGVRIAIGARSGNIFRLVYRRVGLLLAAGVLSGSLATWAARRLIASVVSLPGSEDLGIFTAVLAGFVAVATAAAFVPARAAAKVNPVEALRAD